MNKNKEFIYKIELGAEKRKMISSLEMISGPEKMLHKERVKERNLFSLLKWRLRGDCDTTYQYLHSEKHWVLMGSLIYRGKAHQELMAGSWSQTNSN